MSQITIKVKHRKKKEPALTNSRWSEDRSNLERIHQSISDLIPLPENQIKSIPTGSWFNIQKTGKGKTKYLSVPPEPKVEPKPKSKSKSDTNNIIGGIFIRLFLTKQMESLLKQTCHTTRFLYNQCVKAYRENNKVTDKELRQRLVNGKTNIFRGTKYEESLSKIPYDIRREVLRDFFKAVKIQKELVRDGKRKYFEMKFRKKKRDQNFVLNRSHIKFMSDQEIESYPEYWPSNLFCKKSFPEITHDCRIVWKRTGEFLLLIPTDKTRKVNLNKDICALDPGLRSFQSSFDNKGISYQFGTDNYYSKLEPLVKIAERMRSGIKREFINGKRTFRSAKNSKERRGLRKAALRIEKKFHNRVLEIHRKTANFLCSKYKTIIIPIFKTQRMCQKRDSDGKWQRKIGKSSAQGLSRYSHYKFREFLIFKGKQTGTKVIVGHERSSTKTCTNCLALNEDIGGLEVFECPECRMTFGRDVQAARNILLINWDETGHSLEKKKRRIRIVPGFY